jgi:hypothetical protein
MKTAFDTSADAYAKAEYIVEGLAEFPKPVARAHKTARG